MSRMGAGQGDNRDMERDKGSSGMEGSAEVRGHGLLVVPNLYPEPRTALAPRMC